MKAKTVRGERSKSAAWLRGGASSRRGGTASWYLVVGLAALTASGCVRRTITITTEPPNARVFLNDQEIGHSAVTTDFLWYGDYDVIIRKEGFETLATNWKINPPWYQRVPVDFFAEVLWPGQIHDQHSRHYVLEPAKQQSPDDVVERANALREKAIEAGQ